MTMNKARVKGVFCVCLLIIWMSGSSEEALLERYQFDLGEVPGDVDIRIKDASFGHGDALARLRLYNADTLPPCDDIAIILIYPPPPLPPCAPPGSTPSLRLAMTVERDVEPVMVSLALIVSHITLQVRDRSGSVVLEHALEGFSFGNSASGLWNRELYLPLSAKTVEVIFYGFYS